MMSNTDDLNERLISLALKNKLPLLGKFELTARCNLNCKMCYVRKNSKDQAAMKKEKTAGEWIRLAEEAMEAGTLYLTLTGGEVLLRDDFKEIYEEICRMGFNVTILSNATMVTPKLASWIGRIPPSSMEVTLYGASPETYYKVCGDGSGYERAVRGIDLLLNQGINLSIRTTVIKDNSEDFENIAEFAGSRNIELGIVNYISPRRDGCPSHAESVRLSPQESIQYQIKTDSYYKLKYEREHGIGKLNSHHTDYNTKIERLKAIDNENTDSAFKCAAGNYSFWITWDGSMTPCGLMDKPSVDAFSEGFCNAWNKIGQACGHVPACHECKICEYREYCMSCPARLKAETGYYDQKGYYLCESAKSLKEWIYST